MVFPSIRQCGDLLLGLCRRECVRGYFQQSDFVFGLRQYRLYNQISITA